jgi:outer membrane cobalamin receptor
MATVSLQASGSSDTLVMMNGVPVTLPGGTPIDLSLINLSGVERIEVLPGGSSIHGSRAIGGVVNIITRSADDTQSNAEFSVGSFGTLKGAYSASASRKNGSDYWQVSAFTTKGDYRFRTVNGLERTRENNDAHRLNLLWQQQRYSADELRTAFVSSAAMRRGVPGFAEFPTPQAVLVEQTLTCGWDLFRPQPEKGWAQEYSIGLVQGYTRFKDDLPAKGGPIRSCAADASLYFKTVLARQQKDGRIEESFSATGNAMAASDYGNPSRATGQIGILREWSSGGFSLTPSAALNFCSDMPAQGTGELRVEWKSGNGISVNVAEGRSFRYPEFAELYFPSQGFISGNPNLRSEHAVSISAGMGIERGSSSLHIAAFDRRQHDLIRFLPVSSALLKPMNTGVSRAKGFEADCAFHLAPCLSSDISYAYTRASYSQSGLDFTQTPRNRFTGSLHYIKGGWDCSATVVRESSQLADLFGSVIVPAQQNVDLALSRELGSGRLELTINNLLGADNRDFHDFPLTGRAFEVKFIKTL